jgi:putative hydrolase of the HAD superfamily
VVSNFDHRLEPLLAGLGLRALLDVVVRPADAGAAKPDPRIFAHALARLGVPAAAAVYVGDDAEHDVAGARGAGLAAIHVAELATLAELPARIARLEASPT